MSWMYQDIGGGVKRLLYVLGKVASNLACCCTGPNNCCLKACASDGLPQTVEFSMLDSWWQSGDRFNKVDFCKCSGAPSVDDPRNGIFRQPYILSQLTPAPASGCTDIDSFGAGFPCVWRYHADDVCHYTNNQLEDFACKKCKGVSLDLDIQLRKTTDPSPVTDYCYLECLISMTCVCTDGPNCHKWKLGPYPQPGYWSNDSCRFSLILLPDECSAGDVQWDDPANPGVPFKKADKTGCATCYINFSAAVGDFANYPFCSIQG